MLRLVSVPFSLLLLVVSLGLVTAGASIMAEQAEGGGGGGGNSGGLLGALTNSDGDRDRGDDEAASVAGVSLMGFGIFGAIGAIALLVAGLSVRRKEAPVTQGPAQQQQQQVVIVTDGDARVETRDAPP